MSDENVQPKVDIDNIDALNARDKAKYKPLTPEQRAKKQERFLKALGEHGVVKYACKVAGISRQTYKNWKDTDASFAERLPDTYEERNDTLEYAAYAQAVLGVEEYATNNMGVIFLNGKPVINRKYAPSLLQTLLKANMPDKYREQSKIEHSGTIEHKNETGDLTEDDLRFIAELAKQLHERKHHADSPE